MFTWMNECKWPFWSAFKFPPITDAQLASLAPFLAFRGAAGPRSPSVPPPLLFVALQAAGGSFLCWGRCLDTGVPRLEQPCSPEGRVKSTRRRKSAASGGRAGGARRLAAGPRDPAERSTKLERRGGAQPWKRGTLNWASPGGVAANRAPTCPGPAAPR